MNDYAEKLKDPRWQRKRLEVFNAAGWACAICADGSEELHVHHPRYLAGREPWEYAVADFRCLCKTCHDLSHMNAKKVRLFTERAIIAEDGEQVWRVALCAKGLDEAGKAVLAFLKQRRDTASAAPAVG